MKGRGKF